MRSLLSSYFSRLKPIQDIATFDDEDGISDEEIAEHKTTKSKKKANQTDNSCALKAQLDTLNRLKYIDDSDSLDSAHNLIDESSDREEINRDYEKINVQTKSESLDEGTNMQQLIDGRYGSNKEVIRTLEKVSENLRVVANELNIHQVEIAPVQAVTLNEIKSWLCHIKKLTIDCQDQFRKIMEEKALPKILEDVDDKEVTKTHESACSNISSMSKEELETYNQILQDQVKLLKDRLGQVEELHKSREKKHADEIEQFKEAYESVISERKRLKCEKIELLSQTKELYKALDLKENEIRDFLKHYELKTKETSIAVKKLIDSKGVIEKEKIDLQSRVFELLEERNELKLLTESKNATITKLQKQIFEYETKLARLSIDRDFGYASSKSRETLSTSMIETNTRFTPEDSGNEKPTNTPNKQQRTRKEERTLKCKSNDFHLHEPKTRKGADAFLYEKNTQGSSFSHAKLKIRVRNKSHQQLATEARSKQIAELENDLNKAYDSADFIDIEENENLGQSALSSALLIDKKISLQLENSQEINSCTSSIVSFNNSSATESSGVSSSCSNAPVSLSTSPKSSTVTEKLSMSLASSSSSNSSGESPFIMSQSLTICEDDDEHGFNRTFNDFGNTSQYSVKQPLSLSMSMQTPASVSKRSSKVLSSIAKVSDSSSVVGSIFTTENTSQIAFAPRVATIQGLTPRRGILTNFHHPNSKLHEHSHISFANSNTLNDSKYKSSRSNSNTSQSLYSIIDSSTNSCSSGSSMISSMSKLNNSKIINGSDLPGDNTTRLDLDNASDWSGPMVKAWLTQLGFLPAQVRNAMRHVRSGKALISLSESELEKLLLINNGLHKRKVKLALEELKSPEKCKYEKLSEITNDWLCSTWLREVGLCQLRDAFRLHLVDGRLLASLTKKDLEKYFGLSRKNLQTSLFLAIDLLRKYEFDMDAVRQARLNVLNDNRPAEVALWTNDNFCEWLKLVNLQSFTQNLAESGIHGALVVDSLFNVDYLYNSLKVSDEPKYFNMKKILEDEIKLLKKTKLPRHEMTKSDSTFLRSLNSFRSDKILSFRGSLGRALGKKIKRDISSPLVDDDTYKRIEFSHKIVDMKSYLSATSSAV